MKNRMDFDQSGACRALAIERNNQIFTDARTLNRAALDLLDRPHMDVETFTQYQIIKQKADLKYHEAIEHWRLIMVEFPVSSISAEMRDQTSFVILEQYQVASTFTDPGFDLITPPQKQPTINRTANT